MASTKTSSKAASADPLRPIVIVIDDEAGLGYCEWTPSEHTQDHLRTLCPDEADRENVTRFLSHELAACLLRLMDANAMLEKLTLELRDLQPAGQRQVLEDLIDELLGKPQDQPLQPAL